MALIKCPECGKEVSSRAFDCPHCGCPVNDGTHGNVVIKLTALNSGTGLNFNQNASIVEGNNLLWHGRAGEYAVIYFEKPMEITVRYHPGFVENFPGECTGKIDPLKNRKYTVTPKPGRMRTELTLSPVEFFDDD